MAADVWQFAILQMSTFFINTIHLFRNRLILHNISNKNHFNSNILNFIRNRIYCVLCLFSFYSSVLNVVLIFMPIFLNLFIQLIRYCNHFFFRTEIMKLKCGKQREQWLNKLIYKKLLLNMKAIREWDCSITQLQ